MSDLWRAKGSGKFETGGGVLRKKVKMNLAKETLPGTGGALLGEKSGVK
jgi:hypothetical protein